MRPFSRPVGRCRMYELKGRNMVKICRIALAVVAAAAIAGPAAAAEHTVVQKNKEFDKAELTISAGDSVRFVNEDDHAHNVYSRSAVKPFDVGLQAPGTGETVVFSSPGTVRVRCAIHPKMKMTVIVKP